MPTLPTAALAPTLNLHRHSHTSMTNALRLARPRPHRLDGARGLTAPPLNPGKWKVGSRARLAWTAPGVSLHHPATPGNGRWACAQLRRTNFQESRGPLIAEKLVKGNAARAARMPTLSKHAHCRLRSHPDFAPAQPHSKRAATPASPGRPRGLSHCTTRQPPGNGRWGPAPASPGRP
jgi:hypothetical protein